MKNLRLILFATEREARATIKRLKATACKDYYLFSEGIIAITGMGIHAAQAMCMRFALEVEEIWNLGIAGSFRSDIQWGEVVAISSVGKLVPHMEKLDTKSQEIASQALPLFSLTSSGYRLLSSDVPIHDLELHGNLSDRGDLVDMEGYGIAYAAAFYKRPCYMWKVVSDFCSPEGRERIWDNLDTYSECLSISLSC